MNLQIVPHENAPLFAGPDRQLILDQLVSEMANGNFPTTEQYRQFIRQASYVSLWFFGKFVAGFAGPFDKLNEDLHVDMCNFRQDLLYSGARGAMFLFRGSYKSTIVTELGSGWELLRNPTLRIRITNAKSEYAGDFMMSVKSIFDSNEVMEWLFGQDYDPHHPERNPYGRYVPENPDSQERWNNSEIVLPNRYTYFHKKFREGSIEYGGVGGASEGHHYDLHVPDDIIGEAALNSMFASNAIMENTRNWFTNSEMSLLSSPARSRVIVVGTRYATDDVYADIINLGKANHGYPIPDFKPDRGPWQIYYRRAIEDGKVTFPENLTKASLDYMAKHQWWTYVTQYLNDPQAAGLTQLADYPLGKAWLDQDMVTGEFTIILIDKDERLHIPLDLCDVIELTDPAATESGATLKSSRTACGVLAQDPDGRKILIWLRVGYVGMSQIFNWMFEAGERFDRYMRNSFLETNGAFKLLYKPLQEEQVRRQRWLGLQQFKADGNKSARIRAILEPELANGRMWVLEEYSSLVEEEKKLFPSKKMDILDMLASAVKNSIRPPNERESYLKDRADERFHNRYANQAGY